jgi:predicted ABC-type sugar transport system permease subunit
MMFPPRDPTRRRFLAVAAVASAAGAGTLAAATQAANVPRRRPCQSGRIRFGGIGSIWRTLVGALIIAVLSNGLILTGVSDVWQYVIKGLVIIGAVALDRYRLQGSART